MSTSKRYATREFSYAGRLLQPGDAFEPSERDARVLEAIGRASTKPPKASKAEVAQPAEVVAQPQGVVRTRDMKAEDEAPAKAAAKKAAYKRRDMRAED